MHTGGGPDEIMNGGILSDEVTTSRIDAWCIQYAFISFRIGYVGIHKNRDCWRSFEMGPTSGLD